MTDTTTTTSTTTATTVAQDPRPAFASAAALAASVAAAVRPDQLGLPTPCDGMDVRSLLDHLAMVFGRVASAGRGLPLEAWPGDDASAGDDWAATLRTAGDDALAAWADDRRLGEVLQLPWATMSGAECVGIYVNELIVHTWDLARATGQDPEWDDAAIEVAEACVRQQLPMAERGPMWAEAKAALPAGVPWADPFADAVPVPGGAPAIDRLVAWNGRRP